MEDRERILHLGDGNPQRVDIPVNLWILASLSAFFSFFHSARFPLTEYRISFFSNSAMVQSPSSHSIASGEKNEIR